jgi:hypothetical protein
MDQRLRVATLAGAGLTVLSGLAMPVIALTWDGAPGSDPHGYVGIFSALFAIPLVLPGIAAVSRLAQRRRSGFWLTLVAALCCAPLYAMLDDGLPIWTRVVVGLILLATFGLAGLALTRPKPGQRQRKDRVSRRSTR